jgi:hypothetical protein
MKELKCQSCGGLSPARSVHCIYCGAIFELTSNLRPINYSPSRESLREVKAEYKKKQKKAKKRNKKRQKEDLHINESFFKEKKKYGSTFFSYLLFAMLAFGVYEYVNPGSINKFLAQRVNFLPDEPKPERLLPKVETESIGRYELFKSPELVEGGVFWDPCLPIELVVNDAEQPNGADKLLESAIESIETTSGLKINIIGATSEQWSSDRANFLPELYPNTTSGWAPVLLDWQTSERFRDSLRYLPYSEALGFAGPRFEYSSQFDFSQGNYVTGVFVMDAGESAKLIKEGRGEELEMVLKHELGHLVGLDHVDDTGELMSAGGYPGDWGPGDLQGLSYVGSGDCKKPSDRPIPRLSN